MVPLPPPHPGSFGPASPPQWLAWRSQKWMGQECQWGIAITAKAEIRVCCLASALASYNKTGKPSQCPWPSWAGDKVSATLSLGAWNKALSQVLHVDSGPQTATWVSSCPSALGELSRVVLWEGRAGGPLAFWGPRLSPHRKLSFDMGQNYPSNCCGAVFCKII